MKFLCIGCLLLLSFGAKAQSFIGFGLGGNLSQARFTNANGLNTQELKGLPGATASLLYQTSIIQSNSRKKYPSLNLASLEIGYKSAHIKDNSSHVLTTWDMSYLSGTLGFRHQKRSKNPLTYFYGGGAVADWLISGLQNRGFEQYDLTSELKKVNISATVEAGLAYAVSENAVSTLRLAYLRGLSNIEKDNGQQAFMHGWRLSVAVYFNTKPNAKHKRSRRR